MVHCGGVLFVRRVLLVLVFVVASQRCSLYIIVHVTYRISFLASCLPAGKLVADGMKGCLRLDRRVGKECIANDKDGLR